jgi:hypothetical protein
VPRNILGGFADGLRPWRWHRRPIVFPLYAGVESHYNRDRWRGTEMSRVSNDRLQELIEWYADDCNAYTEQHDRDIQRALTELLNLRLADQPSVEHIVAHTDERVSMTLAQYRQLTANQPADALDRYRVVNLNLREELDDLRIWIDTHDPQLLDAYDNRPSTADQQSVSPTGDNGTIQPDDDISMQDAPQPVEGTGKQSMQAGCTKNDAKLVQEPTPASPQ